jgi:predicted acyltransferase
MSQPSVNPTPLSPGRIESIDVLRSLTILVMIFISELSVRSPSVFGARCSLRLA